MSDNVKSGEVVAKFATHSVGHIHGGAVDRALSGKQSAYITLLGGCDLPSEGEVINIYDPDPMGTQRQFKAYDEELCSNSKEMVSWTKASFGEIKLPEYCAVDATVTGVEISVLGAITEGEAIECGFSSLDEFQEFYRSENERLYHPEETEPYLYKNDTQIAIVRFKEPELLSSSISKNALGILGCD